MTAGQRRWAGACGLAALFLAAGSYQINRPGLHSDELLFAHGVFDNGHVMYETRVFGARFPLMQLPYLGGLKAVIYRPIFALFGVSAGAVRLPALLAGAGVVALTFLLLWRLAGERAAWAGGALLAVDPVFLLTIRCDWGPVAIEHLCKMGGVLLMVQGRYAWGALLFGLALWNKTTFAWTLIGLAAGMLIWYRDQLRRIPIATAALAVVAFAAGAYPWIRYNVRSQGGTAQATARFDASDLNRKLEHLQYSLEGTALRGYLVREGDARPWPRANFTPWLFTLAAVSVAMARQRIGLFFLTVFAAGWLTMAFTFGAGGSAHHVILLWPWPQCVIAAAVSHWRRLSIAVALGVLASAGVIVHYYLLMDRYGSNPPWSEAIYPMIDRVIAEKPEGLFINDWGMLEPVMTRTQGQLPFEISFENDKPVERLAARPGWIFVSHVDAHQEFKNVNARWKQVPGFRRIAIATIRDRQNKPIYELFKFERGPAVTMKPPPLPSPSR